MPAGGMNYRDFQNAVVPGLDGLHRSMRAILDCALSDGAHVLVVGAGGGREIETLGGSALKYKLTGVDPSAEMLEAARASAAGAGVADRTTLVLGTPSCVSTTEPFDAATSLFVMHFLEDDGAKKAFLSEIRQRLRRGATYLHVDVCYSGKAQYDRLAEAYAHHAALGGMPKDQAKSIAAQVREMPVIPEEMLIARLRQAGFNIVTPFFAGLWYRGWWAEAE